MDALSPDAQRLLRTASVCCGQAVPDRLLAEVAGIGDSQFFGGLREAVENHLLLVDPQGHSYAFRHALTRDAVYADMLPGERERLHAAYAAALARDPALAGEAGRRGAIGAGLPLVRGPGPAPGAPRGDRSREPARWPLAPAEALRQLERAQQILAAGDGRAAAYRPGRGRG